MAWGQPTNKQTGQQAASRSWGNPLMKPKSWGYTSTDTKGNYTTVNPQSMVSGGGSGYNPNAPALGGLNPSPAGNNTAIPVSGANGSIYNSADANYIRNIPTGYTPEQMLAMRNRATNTAAAGTAGSNRRVAEMMAAQGLGGSGAALAAQAGNMRSGNAALQAALSDQDIANANAGLQGGFQKAGLLNQLMGTGLSENQLAQQANQFNTTTGNEMYRWGSEQDYGRYRDTQADKYYRDQLALMKRQLGL